MRKNAYNTRMKKFIKKVNKMSQAEMLDELSRLKKEIADANAEFLRQETVYSNRIKAIKQMF